MKRPLRQIAIVKRNNYASGPVLLPVNAMASLGSVENKPISFENLNDFLSGI